MMDLKKIDNIEVDGIEHKDYPDYCDSYISSADYDGEPMTEEQIDDLNNNESQFVYDSVISHIF
jgi:hypothetical protein